MNSLIYSFTRSFTQSSLNHSLLTHSLTVSLKSFTKSFTHSLIKSLSLFSSVWLQSLRHWTLALSSWVCSTQKHQSLKIDTIQTETTSTKIPHEVTAIWVSRNDSFSFLSWNSHPHTLKHNPLHKLFPQQILSQEISTLSLMPLMIHKREECIIFK